MEFLVIEGDFPFWRGFLVEEWKRLPHRTHLLSRTPRLWRPGDYDSTTELPVRDGRLDVPALRKRVAELGPMAGALTVFEPAVGTALEVQRALGLPELSRLEPRALRNKAAMVEVMRRRGLAVPATVHGREAAALEEAARRTLPLPVVVKPAELAGKAGVRLVREPGELGPAIEAALHETLPFEIEGVRTSVAGVFGCAQEALVQEYIEGPEYSVEGYATAGEVVVVTVTEKFHSGAPLFEELGHLQPAALEPAAARAIEEYAVETARAFELVHCFFHLELRLARSGPVMMEINCRIAGDLIPRLIELRTGLSAGETLLRLAAGEAPERPARAVGAAGIRMATVREGGTVRAIHPPLLRGDREFAVFDAGPGSPVHAPKPGGVTRFGYYLVAAADRSAVEKRLDELAAATRIELVTG